MLPKDTLDINHNTNTSSSFLSLCRQLLAPNLIQKYYLPNGFQQDSQRVSDNGPNFSGQI